jgi:hypothetical protein
MFHGQLQKAKVELTIYRVTEILETEKENRPLEREVQPLYLYDITMD